MRKSEIKKAPNNKLIEDYIESYSMYVFNYNFSRGTDRLLKHLEDLGHEMVNRDILTQAQIDKLMS